MQTLLSIVVPTKDRYQYLKPLIELFESMSWSNVELVIQDNSIDNQNFDEYIASLDQDNIHYYYTNEVLSVCANSDLAIQHSCGEYVCFIGDDDGITRDLLPCVEYMQSEDIDSLICNKASYVWPDVHGIVFDFAGKVKLSKYTKKKVLIDNIKELHHVLSKGATTLGYLPCVYHGIVKRSVLEKIYFKTGTYFPGPSPDMANAIALALLSTKHLYYDYPVVIAGKGAKSAGGLGAKHKHCNHINKLSFLPKGTEQNWEIKNPKYWTGETIYAESAIKALRKMGHENYLCYFKYGALYGRFLVFHPALYRLVVPYINLSCFFSVVRNIFSSLFIRICNLITNYLLLKGVGGRYFLIHFVNGIIECEKVIINRLK